MFLENGRKKATFMSLIGDKLCEQKSNILETKRDNTDCQSSHSTSNE